jgi:hypothetical protein
MEEDEMGRDSKQHRLESNMYWAELGTAKPLLYFVESSKLL